MSRKAKRNLTYEKTKIEGNKIQNRQEDELE